MRGTIFTRDIVAKDIVARDIVARDIVTRDIVTRDIVTRDIVASSLQRDQEFSIPGFPGQDFAKSRDPGIFRYGISLKFQPRNFREL